MTYQQWVNLACQSLGWLQKTDPYLNVKTDAYVLLQFVTGKSKAHLMAFSDALLSPQEEDKLTALLTRRSQGEPMAYILGEREFWSLNLAVSPDTLIPRPDTEILVESALSLAKKRLNSPHLEQSELDSQELAILDLGTGTGAIALALSRELTPIAESAGIKLRIIGVDLMAGAVALAEQNAVRNHIKNVQFLQSSWFDKLATQQFDLIVSNPPYIDEEDEHLQQGDVRFEPLTALVAGEQGYADLRYLIENAKDYLKPHGWLLLEHGWQQGEKVRSIFKENLWQSIETIKDYADNERVSLGCWKEEIR